MAVLGVWTKLISDTSIRRSSQTLAVLAGNAYIYGGELRPREPVDSMVYRVALDRGMYGIHSFIHALVHISYYPWLSTIAKREGGKKRKRNNPNGVNIYN